MIHENVQNIGKKNLELWNTDNLKCEQGNFFFFCTLPYKNKQRNKMFKNAEVVFAFLWPSFSVNDFLFLHN